MLRFVVALFIVLAGMAAMVAADPVSATVTTPSCTIFRNGVSEVHFATKWLDAPGTLVGTNGPDVLVGSDGADVIKGLGGDDIICPNQNNAVSTGANDEIDGGSGNDQIQAGGVLRGGSGDDFVFAYRVNSIAHGQSGNDTVVADQGATADGGSGNDTVLTYEFSVDPAPNVLRGGSGNDTVINYTVASRIDCGSGIDSFSANGAPVVQRCENPAP